MKTCSVEDCDRPTKTRGWCKKHYARWLRHGNPNVCLARGGATRVSVVAAGDVFGKLTVVKQVPHKPNTGGRRFLCKCECGGTSTVRASALTTGNTKSCGCAKRAANLIHGGNCKDGRWRRNYSTYRSMLQRCLNPNNTAYEYYGGRGIGVCERWQGENGFARFCEDMGERPPDQTLDRINVNGDYSPDNCRWATQAVQAKNKRKPVRHIDVAQLKAIVDEQSARIEVLERLCNVSTNT